MEHVKDYYTNLKLKKMRTRLFLLFAFFLAWTRMDAQVSYYDCITSVRDYPVHEGMTELSLPDPGSDISQYVFSSEGAFAWDGSEKTVAGIPIGFDFVYHGQTFDKFILLGKGFVALGLKEGEGVYLPANSNLVLMLENSIGLACNRSTYTDDRTKIRYSLTGTAPSRALTVEYVALGQSSYDAETGCTEYSTYSIQLSESDSSVLIHFDTLASSDYASRYSIGLKGEDGDVHYRGPGEEDDWSQSVQATSSTRVAGTVFPKGTAFLFQAPGLCRKPDVSGLVLSEPSVFSDAVQGEIGLASVDADGLMLVLSKADSEPENFPLDGTVYTENTTVGENGAFSILKYGDIEDAECAYSAEGLDANTEYVLRAYLYNYRCSGGPVYSQASAIRFSTLTSAPSSLKVLACGEDFVNLSVEANALDESVVVLQTTEPVTGRQTLGGKFGLLASSRLMAGDTVLCEDGSYGGTVVYIGGSSDAIEIKDLQSGTVYYYGAFSKDSKGNYSTVCIQTDTMTMPVVPWSPDFSKMQVLQPPYGWESSMVDTWRLQTNNVVMLPMPSSSDNSYALATPYIRFPETQDVRLIVEYSMYASKSWTESNLHPEDWSEKDSIVFEVSEDGLRWETFHVLNKANIGDFPDNATWYSDNLTISGFRGKDVRIRIRAVSNFEATTYFLLRRFEMVAISDCDYPMSVSVMDTSIVSDRAAVSWIPGESDESSWNVSYAKVDGDGVADSWSPAINVTANPYNIEGLEQNTLYQVRVQAFCGVGSTSDWTYSEPFYSGYLVPFGEDFDSLPVEVISFLDSRTILPNHWDSKVGELEDVNDLASVASSATGGRLEIKEWKTDGKYVSGQTNGSLRYRFSDAMGTWLLLPDLEFSEEENVKKLRFAAAVTDINGEASSNPLTEGCRVSVLVSYDAGNTYRLADTVAVFDGAALAAMGDSSMVEVDLSHIKGRFRLAFHFSPAIDRYSDNRLIWVDNMEVYELCAPARGLRVESLTQTSATLRWNGNAMVDNWIVRLDSAGSFAFFETDRNAFELTGLAPATSYIASVSHLCEGGDTASWESVSFKTGGAGCAEIANLALDSVGQTTASISWDGTAMEYRIRIRPQAGEYVYYITEDTSYAFDNLIAGTVYECSVQSLCGQAESDTSVYSNPVEFATEELSCFAPEGLEVMAVSYNAADLSWEGDAGSFQVAWRESGTLVWNIEDMVTDTVCTLSGLMPSTTYDTRVRGICSVGDTSAWCYSVSFATEAEPECPRPYDLRIVAVTETSADLEWESDEAVSYLLRYRQSAVSSYDSVAGLSEEAYVLEGLQPNTAYVWSVMGLCDGNRQSMWSVQSDFTTKGTANESVDEAFGIFLTAGRGLLHLMNPEAVYIERVRIYNMAGSLLQEYVLGSRENAVLTTGLPMQAVVVEVLTTNGPVYFKQLVY